MAKPNPPQVEKFRQAARDLDCDEREAEFTRKMRSAKLKVREKKPKK